MNLGAATATPPPTAKNNASVAMTLAYVSRRRRPTSFFMTPSLRGYKQTAREPVAPNEVAPPSHTRFGPDDEKGNRRTTILLQARSEFNRPPGLTRSRDIAAVSPTGPRATVR